MIHHRHKPQKNTIFRPIREEEDVTKKSKNEEHVKRQKATFSLIQNTGARYSTAYDDNTRNVLEECHSSLVNQIVDPRANF